MITLKVVCSLCGSSLVIDEPDGEAYITESDGKIHHVVCPIENPTLISNSLVSDTTTETAATR